MSKKLIYAALMAVGAVALAVALWFSGLLDGWELATWSWRARALAKPANSQIKLILLDQASLDWGSKENGLSWPWPREAYAPILNFCRRAKVRAVAFDVLYTESSVYGLADDQTLGRAIREGPPFVGAVFLGAGTGNAKQWPAAVAQSPWHWQAPLDGRLLAKITFSNAAFPIFEVATNAILLAGVRGDPDSDGTVRRSGVVRIFSGQIVPEMGLAVFALAQGGKTNAYWLTPEGRSIKFGDRRLDLDRRGSVLLRYRSPKASYPAFSAAAIIQAELKMEAGEAAPFDVGQFADSYVFFGFGAPGLVDLRPTPVDRFAPGVVVHATLLDNLLANDLLHRVPQWLAAVVMIVLTWLAVLVILLATRVSQTAFGFLFLPLAVGLAFLAYAWGWWLPLVLPLVAITIGLIGALIFRYATEGRQKAFIKRAFKHYLSPEVIDAILLHPEQLKLGGEKRELTIFFSDLQGFSGISEKLDPQSLTALLNDYLTDMTDIILEEGGTLDKYEGDAIIAFWNAPLGQEDHVDRACRAVLRCQRKLAARRQEFEGRTSGSVFRMRIGLNTGAVVVGNMGSQKRFDYTILGDAANLASRLEGANKAFGTFTMVSEAVLQKTQQVFKTRELGLIKVVGRATPVRVYELRGLPEEDGDPWLCDWQQGLELCYKGEWAAALKIFTALSDRGIADPVVSKYSQRCRALVGGDLASWDGVWNLTEK